MTPRSNETVSPPQSQHRLKSQVRQASSWEQPTSSRSRNWRQELAKVWGRHGGSDILQGLQLEA